MKTPQLISFIKKNLEDFKALNIVTMDVTSLTQTIDAMVIATGTSTRHVQSISKKLFTAVKEADLKPLGMEGEEFGEWILIDLGDVVVHVMLESQRELYQLEKLWAVTKAFKERT